MMFSLDRTPAVPPIILPLKGKALDHDRPKWSVMIPAYNCAIYLPETLKSVLIQDAGKDKMQIEVCDDASTDADIKQIVQQAGKGRVDYFRQEENVGSLRNFETCLNRSRGHLIHLLHGDDKVKQSFYNEMENLFSQFPDMGMAFCRYVSVDEFDGERMISDLEQAEAGILDNWLERIARKQLIQPPAVVVKRSVYERLGGFYGIHYGEDWEMWIRIAANYPVGYIPQVLAEYRKHDASISGEYILSGKNLDDLKQVMEISRQYFPNDKWISIHKAARKFYAKYAINTARKIWGRHQNAVATRIQIRKGIGLYLTGDMMYQAAKLYAKMLLRIKR